MAQTLAPIFYAVYADVRYYALRAVTKLCERHAARGASAAQRGAAESDTDDDADDTPMQGRASAPVSAHDLARNIFDLLSHVPPFSDGSGGGDGGGLRSWCAGAEAGTAVPAADAAGGRQRKRRKVQREREGELEGEGEAEEGDSGKGARLAGGEEQQLRVKWASAKHQRRAFR
jgi:hypothetical protein